MQFARFPLVGVPRTGVTSVGLVKVPFVTVGVVIVGVTTVGLLIVGLVRVLFVSVWVQATLTIAPSTFEGKRSFIESKLLLSSFIASVFVVVSKKV